MLNNVSPGACMMTQERDENILARRSRTAYNTGTGDQHDHLALELMSAVADLVRHRLGEYEHDEANTHLV